MTVFINQIFIKFVPILQAVILFILALYERCNRQSAAPPQPKDPQIVAVYADDPLGSEVTSLLPSAPLAASTYGSVARNGTLNNQSRQQNNSLIHDSRISNIDSLA